MMMRSSATYSTLPRLLLHRRQHLHNLTKKNPLRSEGLMTLIKLSLDRDRQASAEEAALSDASRG